VNCSFAHFLDDAVITGIASIPAADCWFLGVDCRQMPVLHMVVLLLLLQNAPVPKLHAGRRTVFQTSHQTEFKKFDCA